ncbi:hypothetical protein FOZ60_002231 [Perkinsus olseni]|uniref:Uncharacterized protein n=1 Tax=Perkinsus olseni TaxID=32597 RepID=A0A7J6NYH9_PEROL|nr:hypothetical protein FOZ60_002231 [Perkinsus olseni]
MYLCLAGLFFIFAAAHCDSDAFLGATEGSNGGLGSPVDKIYVLYDSPTKKAPYPKHPVHSYTLRLVKECDEIVTDSDGYYDEYFLTGCNIENGYQYLNVPISPTGYDVYQLVPSD